MINIKRTGAGFIAPAKPQVARQVARVFVSKPVTLRVHRMDDAKLAGIRKWLCDQAAKGREAIKAGVDPAKVVEYLSKSHP
jgi:hypothetical protein